MKRLKKQIQKWFPNVSRVTWTRIAYIGLTVGTVAAAFLMVLLNLGIFRLTEKRLYNRQSYTAVNIISAESIGKPLSRSSRVGIYHRCERLGEPRALLPDERTEAEVSAYLSVLYSDCLDCYASAGTLVGGDRLSELLHNTRYEITLRDFYNEDTGAKLGLWCAQGFAEVRSGETYSVSVQLDSRTLDLYSLQMAFFSDLSDAGTDRLRELLLGELGYDPSACPLLSESATTTGTLSTYRLPDGLRLEQNVQTGTQVRFTLLNED